jgi:predicted adenylyl cyclase CyaB
MKQDSYEVEIKCLLGEKENADRLRDKMKELDPDLKELGAHRQLNHYFEGNGDFKKAAEAIPDAEDRQAFEGLATIAKTFSLRTRDADGKILLVLKAAVDDTTSANGTARREVEVPAGNSLEVLDKILLNAGFTYQAKWSRERNTYTFKGTTVTIDKNAGYGYLAEFEEIVSDPAKLDGAKAKLRALMAELGVQELDAARLERMFGYYNTHWHEYYGTEKVFNIA